MPEDDTGLPGLAERLNVLFSAVPSPSGELYTNASAARQLANRGVPVSRAYLSALRSGQQTNPSARLVGAIASLFGVPVAFFFEAEQATRTIDQLQTLVAMRNAGVRGIVARTAGMSDTGIASLAAILEQLRKMEGLDDEPPLAPPS